MGSLQGKVDAIWVSSYAPLPPALSLRRIMGGQAGVIGHLEIGDDVICLAQSRVTKSTPSKTMLYGNPARPHMKVKRIDAAVDMLPEKLKVISDLEKRVAELEEKLGINHGEK
ncbi:hypothetical protein HY768_07125 [candidate division TA06 bacterium]|uniref:Uncharacterized protein n=1 Tax=candidate division TA06 bacterium TaxID=2250710 RepID=A0A933MKR7_UNCT6|nr:hypothetical protein [candidate division TA06 bacterium]